MNRDTYDLYFKDDLIIIKKALESINTDHMDALLKDCEETLRSGGKIVASGLGKNVPICDKFVGTILSLGLNAGFLHTNTAVHGDMGMIHPGDLVIVLTKSGATSESVYLVNLLKERSNVKLWLLTFKDHSALADSMNDKLVIHLDHEGDLWNIVPNNSTTLNLMVLQKVAMEMSKRLKLSLELDFKPNHPGGAIGEQLCHEK